MSMAASDGQVANINGRTLEVALGDITQQDAAAIVNAASLTLVAPVEGAPSVVLTNLLWLAVAVATSILGLDAYRGGSRPASGRGR